MGELLLHFRIDVAVDCLGLPVDLLLYMAYLTSKVRGDECLLGMLILECLLKHVHAILQSLYSVIGAHCSIATVDACDKWASWLEPLADLGDNGVQLSLRNGIGRLTPLNLDWALILAPWITCIPRVTERRARSTLSEGGNGGCVLNPGYHWGFGSSW